MKIKVIILVLLVTILSCKKEKKNSLEDTATTKNVVFKINDGKNCFKEIIENRTLKNKKEVVETNELVINLNVEGKNISGNFDYIPFEGKVNNGNFTGTIKGNIARTICVFDQNGNLKKEEVVFKIEENKISILGGEKEKIDDVWKFKDISKGFYMNEMPRIDCN